MKKFGVLFLGLAVLLTGCSKSYLAEREFYQAEKAYKGITESQVEAEGPAILDPAVAAFSAVFEKYPGTSKALDSLFVVSSLYLKQKKYDDARETLKKVFVNFPGKPDRAAEARFQIGQIYEKEEKWGDAETVYWQTTEYHPLELRGLQAPVHILMHYLGMQYKDAADRVYRQALEHYGKLLGELGPIEASVRVRNYIALAHTVMGEMSKARDEWIAVVNQFSDSEAAPVALIAAAEVSQKMRESALAQSLYLKYLSRYPKSPLVGQMHVRVALIYHQAGAFADAREHYKKAMDIFPKDSAQNADVTLLTARAYAGEGKWKEAKELYDQIARDYPKTAAGLQIPLMIAQYYETYEKNSVKAQEIRDEAVKEYQDIALKNPGQPVEKLALRLMNDAYFYNNDWNETVSRLDDSIASAATAEKKGELLLMKALIVDKQLNNKEQALTLYNDFLTQYSGHSLANIAKSHRDLIAKN